MGRLLPDLAGPRGGAARAGDDGGATRPRAGPPAAPTCTSTRSPPTAPPTSTAILDHVEARGDLDVIAITDHERIDAAVAGRAMAARPRPAVEVVVGEEVTTRGGHLLALVHRRRRSGPTARCATTIAAIHDAGRPGHPGPSARAVPAVRPGLVLRGSSTTPTSASSPTRSRRSTRRRSAGRGTDASSRFADEHGLAAGRQQRRPRPRRDRDRLDHASRAAPRPTSGRRSRRGTTEHDGTFHGTAGQLGTFGHQLRKRGRDARDEVARPRPPRRHGTRPRLSRRPAATAALRRRSTRRGARMKIGLVCPYIYPEAGGVAQHVRFLYENLRLRGHDVRIITASHGPQRSSEGDIIRLGVGFSRADQRLGRDADVLAALHRPGPADARPRAVRPPPLPRAVRAVPVALPAARVERASTSRRSTPTPASRRRTSSAAGCMRGHAARLHGRIAVSAAARHFIDRFFPGDYKVIPNGVDVAALRQRGPDRALAGRHAERAVRRPARAAQGPARPAQGPADPAQDRLRHAAAGRRLRAAGARGAALRRDARPPGRRVPRPRVRRREGPALPDRRRLRLAGDRRRIVRHRAPRGDGRRARRSWPRTSTATRASSGAAARACSCRRASRRRWPIAIARLLDDPALRAEMGAAGQRARRGVQLAAGHGQGRGLLRLRDPPAGRHRHPAGRLPGARSLRRPRRSGRGRRASRDRRPTRRALRPAPAARPRPSRRPPGRSRRAPTISTRTSASRSGVGTLAVDGADRELERVQVGRQDALVGVDDRGRQRQGGDVRVEDHEPADGRDDEPDDEPPRVARADDLDREVDQRQQRRAARSARPGCSSG